MCKAKIKECPFCGCAAFISTHDSGLYLVACNNDYCPVIPVGSKFYKTKAEALINWNKRYLKNDDTYYKKKKH